MNPLITNYQTKKRKNIKLISMIDYDLFFLNSEAKGADRLLHIIMIIFLIL